VQFHIDRQVRLQTTSKHSSLYAWSLAEVDEKGQQVGRDYIPWPWSIPFRATECSLLDTLEVQPPWSPDLTATGSPEITKRRYLSAAIKPDKRNGWAPMFSMFGTDRMISNFHLQVYSTEDESRLHKCTAWGSVSNTAEIDFRKETVPDSLYFYLFVDPLTFDRYAQRLTEGAMHEVRLDVGRVDGFYSGWSPSASTDFLKVLVAGKEHDPIGGLPASDIRPPKLGRVGMFRLTVTTRATLLDPIA
jgi:hypothetical protein